MSVPSATLFAAIVAVIDAFALPSKDAEPVTSPVNSMVRDVANFVAVAAFPVVSALMVAGRLTVATPAALTLTSISFVVPSTLVISPTGDQLVPSYTLRILSVVLKYILPLKLPDAGSAVSFSNEALKI